MMELLQLNSTNCKYLDKKTAEIYLTINVLHKVTLEFFSGISPMGLFWSMRPSPGMPKGIRLIKSNASMPLLTDLRVFPGHLTFEEMYTLNVKHLCTKRIRRWYMAKGVQKIRVKSGRTRGSLFLPPGRF